MPERTTSKGDREGCRLERGGHGEGGISKAKGLNQQGSSTRWSSSASWTEHVRDRRQRSEYEHREVHSDVSCLTGLSRVDFGTLISSWSSGGQSSEKPEPEPPRPQRGAKFSTSEGVWGLPGKSPRDSCLKERGFGRCAAGCTVYPFYNHHDSLTCGCWKNYIGRKTSSTADRLSKVLDLYRVPRRDVHHTMISPPQDWAIDLLRGASTPQRREASQLDHARESEQPFERHPS